MTRAGSTGPRVALAAVPPLLAESLRALIADRAEVTVVTTPTTERFDLAIVTPDSTQVQADLVVVLDDHPSTRGGGTVRGAHLGPGMRLSDLDELLGFVDTFGRW